MNKTAFLFPGQGAQYVEMGKDFFNTFIICRKTYEEANDVLGMDIAGICFNGPEEELLKTENTQPAILTTSVAILRVLRQEGFSCEFTAGLSLGEYSALVNAESIDFSDAVRLVRNRGVYMQKAVPLGVGKMGAIVGLHRDKILEMIKQVSAVGLVEVANYNTPEQVVLSGEAQAVKSAVKLAKEWGAKKALLLPVSAPFHCSMLEPAGKRLKTDLESININDPMIPLINNVDAKIITEKELIISSLVRQVSNSVLWQDSVELMLDKGVRTFIEIGPGTVLSNFVRAIAANLQVDVISESVGDLEGLKRVRELLCKT